MSEPVIGFHTIITALNVTPGFGDPIDLNFPVAALANPLTYDRWKAPSGSTRYVEIDAGVPVECDYVGIAAHNLGTLQTIFGVYANTVPGLTGSPVNLFNGNITTDKPQIKNVAAGLFRYWTIVMHATAPNPRPDFDVAIIYLGRRLTFERCIMGSHAPASLNRRTDFYDNDSEDGQFLGRSIVRRGFETSVSFNMMTRPWVDAQFQPFVRIARLSPYFFQWNPSLYPDDVIFGRTPEDIGSEYTGDRNLMRSAWKIKGVAYDE